MSENPTSSFVQRIALLGNYLPRRCGIATFTADLTNAIANGHPDIDCAVVAMNDPGRRHAYPPRVTFEVAEGDLASYRRAADFLNVGAVDVLSLQHEYGIFGGKAGSHVLSILQAAQMPVVTTLHTILSEPSNDQRRVMDEVVRLSSRIIVMSRLGAELLRDVHGVSEDKMDIVPHGIPSLPNSLASKERLGLLGTTQILTFGLLSPDKGLEYVIDSLPAVVARHPRAKYTIVGATHPHVKEAQGEAYRRSLQLRAHRLGVEDHVVFHDRFVSAQELGEFLAATDIYITPYLNPEQMTSGTLAYAVGTGKAVISTPYPYARELLADARGILVPYRDSGALAAALNSLLDDPAELEALGARAAQHGHEMVWPAVASRYVASFDRACSETASRRRRPLGGRRRAKGPADLPEQNLQHLRAMTDDTGVLQHALFTVPRYDDGYCIDDNARALLLTALLEDAGTDDRVTNRALSSRYLAFFGYAWNERTGRFRNFMSYSRAWLEAEGSEDSQGRALWALGALVGRGQSPGRANLGRELFHAALPNICGHQSPRANAFALLGIHEYLRAFQGESRVGELQQELAQGLFDRFSRKGATAEWPWCEDVLAYDNARLPQALIVSGDQLGHEGMTATGLASLRWLAELTCSEEGLFVPVGSNGFFPRGKEQARFDQQPLEACAMVSASLDAWRLTGDEMWIKEMWRAFSWFMGENELRVSLYDPSTGGCRDGLHHDRANENQGAESTLSFLLSLADMNAMEAEVQLRANGADYAPGNGVRLGSA